MEKKFINLHEGLMSDTMPEKIVDLNDGQGGFVYNFDIREVSEEVTVDPAEEEEEAHTATVTKYRHRTANKSCSTTITRPWKVFCPSRPRMATSSSSSRRRPSKRWLRPTAPSTESPTIESYERF